jgi:hypothetical protein
MRTTIDIPEDLHRIVVSLAAQTRNSLRFTASELMRRGLNVPTLQARAQRPARCNSNLANVTSLNGVACVSTTR